VANKVRKHGDYRNIQIYPFFEKGKIVWYHGDSDYNRSRITSSYGPLSSEELVEVFKDYMRWSVETMLPDKFYDDVETMNMEETVELAESLVTKDFSWLG
jgi:hypothetical protein